MFHNTNGFLRYSHFNEKYATQYDPNKRIEQARDIVIDSHPLILNRLEETQVETILCKKRRIRAGALHMPRDIYKSLTTDKMALIVLIVSISNKMVNLVSSHLFSHNTLQNPTCVRETMLLDLQSN